MDLSQLRGKIDDIDEELVQLFCARMALSAQVADYKKANGLPIHHPTREREILDKIGKMAGPDMGAYARDLYGEIFKLSRDYQTKRNSEVAE